MLIGHARQEHSGAKAGGARSQHGGGEPLHVALRTPLDLVDSPFPSSPSQKRDHKAPLQPDCVSAKNHTRPKTPRQTCTFVNTS